MYQSIMYIAFDFQGILKEPAKCLVELQNFKCYHLQIINITFNYENRNSTNYCDMTLFIYIKNN